MSATQSELRLARLIDERELVRGKHENKLAEIESREDKSLQPSDQEQLVAYRERAAELDAEVGALAGEIKATNDSIEESKTVRRILAGSASGVEIDGDGVVYRDFKQYAFDEIVSRTSPTCASIARQWGLGDDEIQAARERLQMVKRAPTNTTSTTVAGLIPPQHIDQIFQVIDKSRGICNAARKVDLNRGTLTYPQVDTTPIVAAQSGEKTEGGTTGLAVSMVTKTAVTYIGGGDLSWQAINWSTPNALDLWFDEVAADYALKTETAVATVVSSSGFLNVISSALGATPTYAQLMTAIGAGGAKVYANSGRMANAVIMAPDRYWYALGLTSDSSLNFGQTGLLNVSADQQALRVIVSRGLNAGEIHVADMSSILVAETPGAPVEMRVVEPSIGGVEVGLIGAFVSAVTDDGGVSLITTAS